MCGASLFFSLFCKLQRILVCLLVQNFNQKRCVPAVLLPWNSKNKPKPSYVLLSVPDHTSITSSSSIFSSKIIALFLFKMSPTRHMCSGSVSPPISKSCEEDWCWVQKFDHGGVCPHFELPSAEAHVFFSVLEHDSILKCISITSSGEIPLFLKTKEPAIHVWRFLSPSAICPLISMEYVLFSVLNHAFKSRYISVSSRDWI